MNILKCKALLVTLLFAFYGSCLAQVSLTIEGECTRSGAPLSNGPGTPQLISEGDIVTLVFEFDDTTNSALSGTDVTYTGFTTYTLSLSTSAGYTASFAGMQGDLRFRATASTPIPNASQVELNANKEAGLPGFTWDQTMIMLDMEIGSALPANVDGVPLSALLANWPESPSLVSGSYFIEPGGWAESVEVQINSLTLDAGTPPPVLNVPAGLADSTDPWPDPVSDNWYYSSWFGSFYYVPAYGDWVWSDRLGTTYIDPLGTPSGVVIWSDLLDSWIWGSNLNGSWFYYANTNEWIFIEGDSAGGCWIYWGNNQSWTYVTPY